MPSPPSPPSPPGPPVHTPDQSADQAADPTADQAPDQSLDRGTHGLTELRVHGVSGTPPADVLAHPLLRRVAGDAQAGFYRRWFPGGRSADLRGDGRLEAYSWGGLTSGSAARAGWLVLLPFMLVNVAHWTLPPVWPTAGRTTRRLAAVSAALLRVIGFSLTLTLVLAASQVALDVVGWQCAADAACARGSSFVGFLHDGWLGTAGRRLAVTALAPAAVVTVLAVLGRSVPRTTTPERDEVVAMAHHVPLARPTFWRGNPGLAPLRRAHLAGGFALLAAVVAWPAQAVLTGGTAARAALWAAWALVGAAALLVTLPATGRASAAEPARPPRAGAARSSPGRWSVASSVLLYAALAVLGWAVAVAWAAAPTPQLLANDAAGLLARSQLPGLEPVVLGLFVVQAVLLAAMTVTVVVQRPWLTGGGESGITAFGFAGPAVTLLSWLVAGGFSAGVTFRVVDVLGFAADDAQDAAVRRAAARAAAANPDLPFADRLLAATAESPLVLPRVYWWAGLVAFLLVVGLVVLVALLVVLVRRRARRWAPDVRPDYPDLAAGPDQAALDAKVARAWAVASLTDNAGRFLGRAAAVVALLLLGSTIAYAVADPARVTDPPLAPATRAGTWLIGLLGLGLVLLMSQTARNPTARRLVGIVWDVGTFWPRAAHPMAPPSYGERAVPDLAGRATQLGRSPGDRVLLSGHSQGSVLVAAALLQLSGDEAAHVGLITHGSPVRRLYSRFFPAYFGPATLAQIRQAPGLGWANLYRRTDPVGSWVLALRPHPGDTGDVDVRLLDPRTPDGKICGHPDYWFDPGYRLVRQRMLSGPA